MVHTRDWGLRLWLESLEVQKAPSSTLFAKTKPSNVLYLLCEFTREERHAFLRFPNSLKNLFVQRTGVSCDKSECFLTAQRSPVRGRTLSRASALLSSNFSFLPFSAAHPPPLPLCFLFHFLAPALTGKQKAESCALKALACQNGRRLGGMGGGFWASKAVAE